MHILEKINLIISPYFYERELYFMVLIDWKMNTCNIVLFITNTVYNHFMIIFYTIENYAATNVWIYLILLQYTLDWLENV